MKEFFKLILLLLILVFGGCGGGGGGATLVPGPTATIENNTAFSLGQLVSTSVFDYELTEQEYSATIDGTIPITVAKTSPSSFGWLVPSLHDGNHTLAIVLGGQECRVQFSTKKTTISDSIEAITARTLPNQLAAIDDEINILTDMGGQEEAIAWLNQLKTNLVAIPASIATFTPEQKELATAIIYHLSSTEQPSPLGISQLALAPECDNSLIAWRLSGQIIAVDIATVVVGMLLPPPLNVALSGFGLAQFIMDLKYIRQTTGLVIDNCLGNPIDSFASALSVSSISMTALSPQTLTFADNVSQTFLIRTTFSLEDSLKSELQGIISKILSVPKTILPNSIGNYFSNIETSKTKDSPANTYRLGSISNNNISGTANNLNGTLALNFQFINKNIENSQFPFSFSLIDSRDNHTTTVNAILGLSFDGFYYNQELFQDGFTHTDSYTVSGTSFSGTHSFFKGEVSGNFLITGRVDLVTRKLFGNVVINNAGTRYSTFSGDINYFDDGSATLCWGSVDPVFGEIGGCGRRSSE